jgi:hypothetical protein
MPEESSKGGGYDGAAPAEAVEPERQAALLSQKLQRFGVLGAGVIQDSLATLKLAQANENDNAVAAAARPQAQATPVSAPVVLAPPEVSNGNVGPASVKTADGATLTRVEILQILAETVRVQGIVQQEVSVLARKLAKEDKGEKKKKKRTVLSFTDAHKKILELGLPREPLEDYKLSEANFQQVLLKYEEDEEVMLAAQKLLHPAGKGDSQRALGITIDKIVEIHVFMVTEMQKVLSEFLALPREERRSFTGKGCETTAELLVSMAVEQQLSVRCEDVEQAVIMYEEQLQGHPEFTRCTEQLASMMQHLIGSVQPRVEAKDFIKVLQQMGESTKKAKVFAKKLYEDYRAKTCNVGDAYKRFESFSGEVACSFEGQDLPELSSMEMQICYEEYKDDAEVRAAWDLSGAESSMMMGAAMMQMGTKGDGKGMSLPEPAEKSKGKKLKASEIVEMQELMVDELKRTTEAVCHSRPSSWKADLAVQMVQALASAAVERRYGTSAEEMTLAGFQHAMTLQKNERFVRATEKQQELLMTIAKLCGGGENVE